MLHHTSDLSASDDSSVDHRVARHGWLETELASGVDGCVLEAPVSSTYRFARERFVVPLGSSEWHEPEPGANGSRHLCVTGIVRRVKRRRWS
jgi:hypothetical protein